MRPRLVLHLAALVLPVAAVVATLVVLDGRLSIGGGGGTALRDTGCFCLAAVVAAQIAAALGAPLLLRAESRWLVPLAVGFGMALLTHALFAPLSLLFIALAGDGISMKELIQGSPVIALVSAVFVGWLSAPLTMAASVFVDRLRRRELARAAV